MHPAFIPTLFVATSLLIAILLTSEKVTYKLLYVIVLSVLIHSFFSVIFPAGDLSGQQFFLGRTRLIYNNDVLHGWPPWTTSSIQSQVYEWFRGIDFQAAVSIVFARMLSIDLLWVHLFLVPVLWGVFTPIAAYLIAHVLTQNEKAAVLSSLLFSAFPYATYFGAISVPNSIGFIFLFYTLLFILKNLESNDFKSKFIMLAFSFLSLLAHYLTGIMALSPLLLAAAFKSYSREGKAPSISGKASLIVSFIVSVTLLPLSLIYLRLLRSATYTTFTLDKLYQLPLAENMGLFFVGELFYAADIKTIFLVIIGPLLAFLCMIYLISKLRKNPSSKFRVHILFLFAAFLLVLVDYRILKLFMSGLPLNEERLWVLRDFLAAPFVAIAAYEVSASINAFLKTHSLSTTSFSNLKALSKGNIFRVFSLLSVLNILIPLVLSGWVTVSLNVAYPQVAPLQTTWYELEAVRYLEENTNEKYVVIGDIWTIYAGEIIVGLNNPRAYYFGPRWMILAMNYTDTTIAYFIVTEPRVGAEDFNNIVSKALQNKQLTVEHVPSGGKLYVFSYGKG